MSTGHLSVPSIIETYARRLCEAYPDHRDEFIRERDDLLAWYSATVDVERWQRIETAARRLWDIAADDHVALNDAYAALRDALGEDR